LFQERNVEVRERSLSDAHYETYHHLLGRLCQTSLVNVRG
jgi:hypothetical protein